MQIRDATIDDLPVIVAIYNTVVPTRMVTADLEPVSVASRKEWFEAHSPNHHPLWIAQDGAEVAGWLSLSKFNVRPAYHRTSEVSVYLAPEQRRRGRGTQLLEHSIEHAPKIGVDTLVGLIFGHNEPSLRLFEKMGFSRWGHLPRVAVLDGVERDLVIVGRRV
jgi:L-amino acid N-acyltransferase YncA